MTIPLAFPAAATLAGLGLPQTSAAAITGARIASNLPALPAPVNATPTLSLSSSAPGTTQWQSGSGGVVLRQNFTLAGGRNYIIPSPSFPYTNQVGKQQQPAVSAGYGSARVEFLCNDPSVTFWHQRSDLGVMRVLCDGTEIFRVEQGVRQSTAQAGGAATITLDSSASATNGIYVGQWVHITSGTGSGQYGLISGYVGSTKVATVSANWSVQPDNTSVFEITDSKAAYSNLTNTGASTYYITASWAGETRLRHYVVECDGQPFASIYTSLATATVFPAPKASGSFCVWVGDSFSGGTGAGMGPLGSLAKHACDILGWELCNLSIGGTGYLNPNGGATKSFTVPERLLPPPNAWFVNYSGSSAGSFTVTQGATSVTVGYLDTTATIQSAFDSAFGSGAFSVVSIVAATQRNLWIMGRTAAAVTTPMTANFSGLTGGSPTIVQWLGDMALMLPLSGDGVTPLPFEIVLACGHNDTTGSDPLYTQAAVQAALTTLLQGLRANYPMISITVVGSMYLPGGSVGSDAVNCNAGMLAAVRATLSKINGRYPFIDTITASWFTGTGRVGATTGSGNSDTACAADGVHPTGFLGHPSYGGRLAREIQALRAT